MSKYFIYKLCCDDCNDVYVGSTINFKDRKKTHKSRCKNEKDPSHNYKVYKIIREHGGWDNWKMVCIEECDETITTEREAEEREEEWIKKLNAELNSQRAFKTNKDKSNDDKTYYQKNKEEIKAKRKEEYWADPQKDHDRCRKYRENNPDKVAEANKKKNEKWHETKDVLNAKRREVIECGCGVKHTIGVTARHIRTKKHQEWLKTQAAD